MRQEEHNQAMSAADVSLSSSCASMADKNEWPCTLIKKRKRLASNLLLRETSISLTIEHRAGKKIEPKTKSLEFPFNLVASIDILQKEDDASEKEQKKTIDCLSRKASFYELDDEVVVKLVYFDPKLMKKTKKKAKPRELLLIIDRSNSFEENLEVARRLQIKLTKAIKTGTTTTRPILLILNPFSGKGKSQKIFHRNVRPMLEQCGIHYKMIETQHAKHATEIIRTESENADRMRESYSAVVTLSGDGLLFEVVNGFADLIERSSSKQIPIPIGIIPGGSGNGLVCSINSLHPVERKPTTDELFESTMHIIKGRPIPMDMVRYETPSRVYFSFLSFGWGLMADIDIESERLRFLGEPRFSIWSIYRSLSKRKYQGTLSYLPAESKSADPIPPLGQPVPDHWTTVTGNFMIVYAAYQRYLNSLVKFAPEANLADGMIYLTFIEGEVTSCQLIRFLMATENGGHVKLNYVRFVAVKAFRLVPLGTNDIVTIDGEQIECSPIQAQVLPNMAEILVRPS